MSSFCWKTDFLCTNPRTKRSELAANSTVCCLERREPRNSGLKPLSNYKTRSESHDSEIQYRFLIFSIFTSVWFLSPFWFICNMQYSGDRVSPFLAFDRESQVSSTELKLSGNVDFVSLATLPLSHGVHWGLCHLISIPLPDSSLFLMSLSFSFLLPPLCSFPLKSVYKQLDLCRDGEIFPVDFSFCNRNSSLLKFRYALRFFQLPGIFFPRFSFWFPTDDLPFCSFSFSE